MHYAMSICRAVTPARSRSRVVCLLAFAVLIGAGATLLVSGAATGQGSKAAGGRPTGGGTSASLVLHQASALTLALSPDHKTITMNLLGNLWTLPGGGGTATRTTSLQQDTAYPDWSPDGKTIAFQSQERDLPHLGDEPRRQQRQGAHLRVLRRPRATVLPRRNQDRVSSDRPPDGSPAGTATGSYNVWTLTLATGQLTEITHQSGGTNDYYPTWTPDGKQITYVDTSHAIESVAADGTGAPTTLYSTRRTRSTRPPGPPTARAWPTPSWTTRARSPSCSSTATRCPPNEDVFAFPARWARRRADLCG